MPVDMSQKRVKSIVGLAEDSVRWQQLLLPCHPSVVLLRGCGNSRKGWQSAPEHQHACGRGVSCCIDMSW